MKKNRSPLVFGRLVKRSVNYVNEERGEQFFHIFSRRLRVIVLPFELQLGILGRVKKGSSSKKMRKVEFENCAFFETIA